MTITSNVSRWDLINGGDKTNYTSAPRYVLSFYLHKMYSHYLLFYCFKRSYFHFNIDLKFQAVMSHLHQMMKKVTSRAIVTHPWRVECMVVTALLSPEKTQDPHTQRSLVTRQEECSSPLQRNTCTIHTWPCNLVVSNLMRAPRTIF